MGQDSHFHSLRFMRDSVNTGNTVLEKAVGNPNFFDYIQDEVLFSLFHLFNNNGVPQSNGELAIFGPAMTALSRTIHKNVIGAYDFNRFNKICDVGGGTLF